MVMAVNSVIEVEHLRKTYKSAVAVDDVSFQVNNGEIFGLLGPNGAGKTTTVECLQGLRHPDSGKISVLGLDPIKDASNLKKQIGSQLQESALPDRIKVWEALDLFAATTNAINWATLIEQWGLKEKRNAAFGTLSGGQRQRLLIALALVNNPKVVFLDEMTTGLDPAARRDLSRHVETLRETEGVTILLTTHVLEEAGRCDRLVLLHEGNIVAQGTPAELTASIGGDVVVLEAADTGALAEGVERRFGVRPTVADGHVRIEIPNGHRFITDVVEAFPGAIDSVGLHKPTLEDVFVRETGASIA